MNAKEKKIKKIEKFIMSWQGIWWEIDSSENDFTYPNVDSTCNILCNDSDDEEEKKFNMENLGDHYPVYELFWSGSCTYFVGTLLNEKFLNTTITDTPIFIYDFEDRDNIATYYGTFHDYMKEMLTYYNGSEKENIIRELEQLDQSNS